MDVHEITGRKFGGDWGEELDVINNRIAESVFIRPVEQNKPLIKLVKNPYKSQNFRFGVGVLSGGFISYNLFARKERVPYTDSVFLYDGPNGKPIGFIPRVGGGLYLYEAQVFSDTLFLYGGGAYDTSPGMSSIEYLTVFEKEGKRMRILSSRLNDREVWVKFSEMKKTYYDWKTYFEEFPEGNDGWQKGYQWIGGYDYLFAAPNENAECILELPEKGSIFILDRSSGSNWLKVEVREIDHVFGDGLEGRYTGKDVTYNTWQGWIRVINDDGYPNLEEIILGC